jgi:plasmid stability protein
MGDITLKNIDRALVELLAARVAETGRSPEDVAKEALLNGLLWSPEERAAYAERVRAMTPRKLDDSTEIIRRLRDAQ